MASGALPCQKEYAVSMAREKNTTSELFGILHDEDSTFDIDNNFKRSGIHNLNRTGYHEEKCRNVLVRYCAHIPRNYQYKDGIQQIFLILREHLGDENLDLAGGVLYELIEVDCEHTDDPGAAFQRWKHDHLRRYADLELPHVPHMTTITSSIIPTKRLSQWRSTHPNRYPFVLSDSSPSTERASVDPSCIRHRKAWMIDHTLYISSRNDGTRPLNSPNPKEFHERQWDSEYGSQGRLVEERDVPITSSGRPSEITPPGTADKLLNSSNHRKGLRRYSPGFSLLQRLTSRVSLRKRQSGVAQGQHTWRPDVFVIEQTSQPRDKEISSDTTVPLPVGCQIPNAIFARKYLLVDASESLPESLSLRQMPTAESKATDTIVEAVAHGMLDKTQPWLFRGPFTPQLGFDGGLDYQWTPREPIITVKKFHLDTQVQDPIDLSIKDGSEEGKLRKEIYVPLKRTSTKRQGIIFGLAAGADGGEDHPVQKPSNYITSNRFTHGDPSITVPRSIDGTMCLSLHPDEPSIPGSQRYFTHHASGEAESSNIRRCSRQKCGLRRRDSLLFQNIEFTMPAEVSEVENRTSHRKVTVVELEPSCDLPASHHDYCRTGGSVDDGRFGGIRDDEEGVLMLDEPTVHVETDGQRFWGMPQEMAVGKLQSWKFNERVGWKCRSRRHQQQGNNLVA